MSLAVDPPRQPAHDDEPRCRQLAREGAGHRSTVRGACTRTDDRDGRRASAPRARRRRARRAAAVGRESRRGAPGTPGLGAGCSGSRSRGGQLTRDAVGERLGDVAGIDGVDGCERCDRAADARDPRPPAPGEREPIDCARSSSEAASVRRGTATSSRCRASRTRRRTADDGSDRGAASSAARVLGMATARSNRSRSARESFSRYAASRCGVHEHSTAGSPAPRTGTCSSSRRAGTAPERARAADAGDETTPSSSGCRSDSSTDRGNSGSSSRSSTPRCARRDLARPRARASTDDAGTDTPWCGARNGGSATSGLPGREQARDRVDSRHLERLAAVSAGRIPGSRRASIVFPVPGGPISSRLCAPAAAISSARRARSWPRTSARSGAATSSRVAERLVRRSLDLAPEVGDDLGKVADGHRLDARERDLGGRLRRADDMRRARIGALLRRRRACPRPAGCVRRERARRREACAASRSGGSCLVAPSTASEIGRSKPDPSLRSAAGARLTVIRRLTGHSSEAETTPLRTRCFASWHARSARPTIAKPGIPGWR